MGSFTEREYGICGMESFWRWIYASDMRHKDNSDKPSQEVPTQVFGSDDKQSGEQQVQEPGLPTRLRFKVGPQRHLGATQNGSHLPTRLCSISYCWFCSGGNCDGLFPNGGFWLVCPGVCPFCG